jgi:Ca-activated chloride channel family protein
VKLQEKIMLSPIAVGVSEAQRAARLGHAGSRAARSPGRTSPQAAKAGKLSYALSNPATSNQGFMALDGRGARPPQSPRRSSAADVDRGAIAAS